MNPGMILRIEQESIFPLKDYLQMYLPQEIDLKELPQNYEFSLFT